MTTSESESLSVETEDEEVKDTLLFCSVVTQYMCVLVYSTGVFQRHVHDDLVAPSSSEAVGAKGDDLHHVAAVGHEAGDDGALDKPKQTNKNNVASGGT